VTAADRLKLRAAVKEAEGFRGQMYTDSEGFWTIGFGRLIDPSKGGHITTDEAEYLLANDLKRAELQCESLPVYHELSPVRQAVLIEMCFNLGLEGLKGFKRTLRAISEQDYDEAAVYMLESKWARQVGRRAVRLSEQMKTGQWP
jgi:lysozyme